MQALFRLLQDHVLGAWRYRWLAVAVAALVALGGWYHVFKLPDKYQANGSVMVDSRTALRPALQGLTTEQDINPQLNFVYRTLLVDKQLCRMANQAGMFQGCEEHLEAFQPQLAGLRGSLSVVGQGPSGGSYQAGDSNLVIWVSYASTSRALALKMVGVVLDTIKEETLGEKQEGSQNAQEFLARQLNDAQDRLRQADDRLAAFRATHAGTLPTDGGGYAGQLQKENQAVQDTQTRLVAAQNRRQALIEQLRSVAATATAPVVSNVGGTVTPLDTTAQIAAAQAHLDELLLRYTDKHPDVVAARAQLAELKARRATEVQGAQRGDANAVITSGAAANPVYQSTQLAINQADVDIAAIRAELGEHQSRVAELRQLLKSQPEVDSEYSELTRVDEAAKTRVTELQGSYDKSRLGQQAAAAGDVRFRVVQPPTAQAFPVSPRRGPMLFEMLAAGLAAGLVVIIGLDLLHPLVGSAESVAQALGVPVLASTGPAFPSGSRARFRAEAGRVGMALAVLVCALGVVVFASRAGFRL